MRGNLQGVPGGDHVEQRGAVVGRERLGEGGAQVGRASVTRRVWKPIGAPAIAA